MSGSLSAGRLVGIAFLVFVYVYVLGPPAILLFGAFNEATVFPGSFEGLTLRWMLALGGHREFVEAARVSAIVATIAAVIGLLIGTPVAFAFSRRRFPGREALESFFLAPVAMPQLVISLAMLQLMNLVGLPATTLGLVLAHTVAVTPYVVRAVMINLANFDRSVEEAALSLGATPAETLAYVTLPLIRTGLGAGFVFAFILSFSNVPLSLFLTSPSTMTLPMRMLGYMENRFDPIIAAVASLVMIVTTLIVVFLEKVVRVRVLV